MIVLSLILVVGVLVMMLILASTKPNSNYIKHLSESEMYRKK